MHNEVVLEVMRSWLGANKYGSVHKSIIDLYNSKLPLPVGYRVTYDDDWCDVTVSAAFMKAGVSHLIDRECSVQRHIAIFKNKGIWLGRQRPQVGDIVCWDWDSNGWSDHIGMVERVAGDNITTIEGNTTKNGISTVGRNTYVWNDRRIAGYARPKYKAQATTLRDKTDDELANEIIAGLHGTGIQRKQLLGDRYERVQKLVNEKLKVTTSSPIVLRYGQHTLTQDVVDKIVKKCRERGILPSYALVLLHYEGLWGNSETGRKDNNLGGMTWNGRPRPSGVKVTQGVARPVAETGFYNRYASIDDFLEDWTYLLRPNGPYKVSGADSFESSIKGMFIYGGAKYDYATMNVEGSQLRFEKYLVGMASRKKSIEQVNGPLERFDVGVVNAKKDEIQVERENLNVIINGVRYVPAS